jgi:hypothetical protein
VDAVGDVWIANYKGKSLVEYAHGGAMPLRTLSTDGTAIGCSINPLNGDVAVANHIVSLGGSDIQILPNGSQCRPPIQTVVARVYNRPATMEQLLSACTVSERLRV